MIRLFAILLVLASCSASAENQHIRKVLNLNYAGTQNPRPTLDLILPTKESSKPRPLVVFIHGGGWHQGSKKTGHYFLPPLVNNGEFAAATINYRLTGEAIWPAQIHDCKAAIRWLKAHAKEYNIDPERIAVSGMSAGGHLASMLGCTGEKCPLDGKVGPHLEHSSNVQCVVNLFGPSHFVTLDEKQDLLRPDTPPTSAVARLLGDDPKQRLLNARAASPTTHIDKNDPPVFIAHGDKDPLVPYQMSVNYERELKKKNISCTLVKVQGAGHGFKSLEVNGRIEAFLQRHLLNKDVPIATTPVPLGQ